MPSSNFTCQSTAQPCALTTSVLLSSEKYVPARLVICIGNAVGTLELRLSAVGEFPLCMSLCLEGYLSALCGPSRPTSHNSPNLVRFRPIGSIEKGRPIVRDARQRW